VVVDIILKDHIEKTIINGCTVFNVLLGELNEKEVLDLIDLIQEEISQVSGSFITMYDYKGFLVTPNSKKKAKELIKFVDATGRSKGTIAYGADYFIRLLGAIIRPSASFVETKEQAIKIVEKKCAS
jgi:hypothetical protein